MNATWTYDVLPEQVSCAAKHSCGQLVRSSTIVGGTGVDYRQDHSYDKFGRPDTTTTVLDVVYRSKLSYDDWGRLSQEKHQRGSDAGKIYDRRYNAWGQLQRIERQGQAIWTANGKDPLGHLTSTTLGNGLGVTQVFNGYTQRLTDGWVKAGANQLLLESYGYDALGNVSQRVQQWGGASFTENFEYDSLNRLWHATIVGYGQQEFVYDDIGNIRRKSGVGAGNYVYPGNGSPRPHAVMSIPGVGSFAYDGNGNLTSGAGRTISWNSFDMPITMTKGGLSSTFYYGPDHQRVKQVRSDGVTLWYAGAMEVETSAAGTTVKTYLPEGLGVEVDKSGATQLYYMHRDRLGSVVAMSNPSGSLVEKTAYDSWGKRRELASPNTPDSIDGVTDNKGFTGHEMPDQLDLVHMNGRVYDPLVARFLSADPIIQDPMHSQSYNRYSYVWNNPTNLTDPSGFKAESPDDNSGSTEVKQDCDKRCRQLKADAEREKIRTNSTGWTLRSASKDNSNGAGSANSSANSGVTNLTAGDIIKSELAGAGNAIANVAVGVANILISIGEIGGNAELIGPVKPFTPVSNYFGQRGAATADGLLTVTGGTAIGKAGAGLLEGKGTEVVYRWMSKAELKATEETGLLRGGRDGTHYVTDAANSTALSARMRSALPQTPEVRVKLEVPAGTFSAPSKVQPAFNMPGGGMERTATGKVPVRILEVR